MRGSSDYDLGNNVSCPQWGRTGRREFVNTVGAMRHARHVPRIGIVGAMEVEVAPLKEALVDPQIDVHARMEFVSGLLEGIPVVVVHAGVGKVNAGICAQLLCERGVEKIIFTGVAGGIDPDLSVCDVVISTECGYWDIDNQVLGYQLGEIPGLATVTFPADAALRSAAVAAAHAAEPTRHVVEGMVLTGDRFVSSEDEAQQLHETFGGVCVEEEGAGLAHACWLNDVPFVVIRAISDLADDDTGESYGTGETSAAEVAAHVTQRLITDLG